MATVVTPSGDVLEGVHGQLLDYYRGEGYTIREDGEETVEQAIPEHPPVPTPPVPQWPGDKATKAEIVQYAVDAGLSELTVDELLADKANTREVLVEKFGRQAD